MASNRIDNDSRQRGAGVFTTKYSRSEGVSAYRRRRRLGRLSKIVVILFLVVVVGGAGILLGRQFFDYSGLPIQVPEVPTAERPDDSTEQAEITTVQPASITILSAGDVVASGSVIDSGKQEGSEAYNFTHLFEHIKSELTEFDIRTLDQETALAGTDKGVGDSSRLNAPQDLGRSEVAAGFNVILRASDHTLDFGTEGIHTELSWWREENGDIPILGVAEPNPDENPGYSDYVNNVYVYEKDGFKIAVLNHTWNVSEDNQAIVSPLTEDKVASDVSKAREEGAEMIIACPHWGVEGNKDLSEEETTFARLYAEQGVDVIVGDHPRVLQKVEVIENGEGHKTVCFYSLGCVISPLEGDNLLGGIAELTLERDEEGNCSVSDAVLKPVVTHRAAGTDFGTYLLSDYTDELAASSWDASLTPEYWATKCREILGDDYDSESAKLKIDLDDTVSLDEIGQSVVSENSEVSTEGDSGYANDDYSGDAGIVYSNDGGYYGGY